MLLSIVLLAGFAEAQNYTGAILTLIGMGIETLRANRNVDKTDIHWQELLLEWILGKKKGQGNGSSNKPTTKLSKVILTHNDREWKRQNANFSKSKAV